MDSKLILTLLIKIKIFFVNLENKTELMLLTIFIPSSLNYFHKLNAMHPMLVLGSDHKI